MADAVQEDEAIKLESKYDPGKSRQDDGGQVPIPLAPLAQPATAVTTSWSSGPIAQKPYSAFSRKEKWKIIVLISLASIFS